MLDGVIFDLDGVICSTDEYHYLAWQELADSLGVYFDQNVNNRLRGVSRMDCLDIILEQYTGPHLSFSEKLELAEKKNKSYRRLLVKISPADLSEEVKTTLDKLRSDGLKLGIGSSSKNAQFILDRLGLGNYFDAVSDGNNILKSKPDPEVFLKCAGYLGLKPARCLVVEDAIAGADAGKSGGFPVACVGDAAREKSGDYNLGSFSELIGVVEALRK